MPILTFIVKTEPKIFKETLLLFMKFMSAFWKISYFNSLFEEKIPKPWNLIKCENGNVNHLFWS